MEEFYVDLKESIRRGRIEMGDRLWGWAERLKAIYAIPEVGASVDSILLLFAMFAVDSFIQHPMGLRMMYILPIWLAARRGGRIAGYVVVAATSLAITIIDMGSKNLDPNDLVANSAMMLAVLILLMTYIEHFESNLRKYAIMAKRDPLTGAMNRLGLDEYLDRAIDRALGSATPLTVAMIDCDRFKELNDEHGHAYGDHVLRTLARLLKRYAVGGTVARNGGDEFVLVLPSKHPGDVRAILDRVNWKLRESTILGDGSASFTYGISRVGVDGTNTHELLAAADNDMYRNKHRRHDFAVIETVQPIQASA